MDSMQVSKFPNATWPKGAFIETFKVWQQEWFITKPRCANWVAIPEFRSEPPTRLTSWTSKVLDWGSEMQVNMLKKCITNMLGANLRLTNVVQIMLFPPCPSLPTLGLPYVGVQSGGAVDPEALLLHYARRNMQAALQGLEELAYEDRGHRARHRESNLRGNHHFSEDLFS